MAKLEKVKSEIEAEIVSSTAGSLECMVVDLADYDSIKEFVKGLSKYKGKLDVFFNNAGVIPSSTKGYQESKYGIETTFQSNFLSTVVLTESILPLMKSPGGRLVHMSSLSHADVPKIIDFSKIPSTKETFGGYNKDYAESKWLLTAYSSSLARRLAGKKIDSVCADPGVSPDSAMWDEVDAIKRFLARYVFKFLTKTTPQAAGCGTALVVADTVTSGGYYQSGVLVPALRADTEDPAEWGKVVAVMKKVLPADLQRCAQD